MQQLEETDDEVLEYRNDRRHRSKRHEQEEHRAPKAAKRHRVEHVRQRDE